MMKTIVYPRWTLSPSERNPEQVKASALTDIASQLGRIASAMEAENERKKEKEQS